MDEGCQIYAYYHRKAHVNLGVFSYKADEFDNSDFTGNWLNPEFSQFPSGADGEQMHNLSHSPQTTWHQQSLFNLLHVLLIIQ